MRIGELARRSSVSPKTIRYYEDIGVLGRPPRTPGGFRDYAEDALGQLAYIRAAQAAGLRLGEIRAALAFRDHGTPPCRHVLEHITELNGTLPALIEDLRRLHEDLRQLARRAPAAGRCTACDPPGPVPGRYHR